MLFRFSKLENLQIPTRNSKKHFILFFISLSLKTHLPQVRQNRFATGIKALIDLAAEAGLDRGDHVKKIASAERDAIGPALAELSY